MAVPERRAREEGQWQCTKRLTHGGLYELVIQVVVLEEGDDLVLLLVALLGVGPKHRVHIVDLGPAAAAARGY